MPSRLDSSSSLRPDPAGAAVGVLVPGRPRASRLLEAFVAGIPDGVRGLLIRGSAGMGKTTCVDALLAQARDRGWRVLRTRPAEEERTFSGNGLADLFGASSPGVLMVPSRDPLGVGRAVLAALRDAVAAGPTVLAVDDSPWLDHESAKALRYALRRLEAEPIGVVSTVRTGEQGADQLRLRETLPGPALRELALAPLTIEGLRTVLAGELPRISRPRLRRIHAQSDGNPMYALELARGTGSPSTLVDALRHRLAGLPDDAAQVVRMVAAAGPVTPGLLRQLVGSELVAAVDTAVDRHVLVLGDDLRLRFSHPLLRSVCYESIGPASRRSLHQSLAARAPDDETRARHLAAAADSPDSGLADALEGAADRARERGALAEAAEFSGECVRLTPAEEEATLHRRTLAHATNLARSGEVGPAVVIAREVIATLPPGPERARALVDTRIDRTFLETGADALERALADVGQDHMLRGRILDLLGWVRAMFGGDLEAGTRQVRDALELARRSGDADLELRARTHWVHLRALAGAAGPADMAALVEPSFRLSLQAHGAGPRAWLARQLLWDGRIDSAREVVLETLAHGGSDCSELDRPYRLYDLALIECAAGDLAAAGRHLRDAVRTARDADSASAEEWLRYPQALVAALSGDDGTAGPTARLLLGAGQLPMAVRARQVLGLMALARGDVGEAVAELTEAVRLLERWGVRHPGMVPVVPDAVEALAEAGVLDEAARLTDLLEARSRVVGGEWAAAQVIRCRALLALAGGRVEDAEAGLVTCREAFTRLGLRLDAARALLALGRTRVRAGRRTTAVETLAEARDEFVACGARGWASRTATELARLSPAGAGEQLTSTERRIAALVAQGHKNREIASTMFLALATVEAHLTRTYRKLGIRSRADLTRLVASGQLAGRDG